MAERKRSRKMLWGIVILIVLIVVGVIGFIDWKNNQSASKNKEEQETSVEKESEDDKEEKKNDNETTEESVYEKKIEQYDGNDPNEADGLSGVVTYAGVNDGVLMIRLNIDQFVSSGKCELALMRGDSTVYNDFANVIADVATSTCEGFDVPVNGLGSGHTDIVIKISADGKVGEIKGGVDL